MGIRMEVSKIPKYRKLTKADRILIAQWRGQGLTCRAVAKLLGRHVSTVSREIKGNSFKGVVYEPLHAQHQSEIKKNKAWEAKEPLKNGWLYSYVLDKLRCGWSPEQISGRLRLKYKDLPDKQIGVETIYRFIYGERNRKLRLWEYLRRKQGRRRIKGGRKAQRVRIPDRVSIHLRPKVVDDRLEIGHWEGDSIVGRGHLNGLHTEYERVTSVTRLEKLERITAEETIKAQTRIFGPLPEPLRKTDTLDNGSEMARHSELRRLGIATYFADPYSSWQRGGNENANLWVRYYFPKGTNFSKVTKEEIKDVEWELNNRPRKRLGFKTPMEVMSEYL